MTTDADGQMRVQLANISRLVELIAGLKKDGYDVVLITSGAVGMGCVSLGLKERPTLLSTKQAVAAAGQSYLMRLYTDLFKTVDLHSAQVLLSQNDFLDKAHWSNVKRTLGECLRLGIVPIVNENDTTSTLELRFGDNDNLAALTAVQLAADALYLFTDVDYLYTANPRVDPKAQPLRVVPEPWHLQVDTRAEGSGMGTGGMTTKIIAACTVSAAGIPCGLINGAHVERLQSFLRFDPADNSSADELPQGTYFKAMEPAQSVKDTRRWILSLPVAGEIVIDDGATKAVVGNHSSLFPVGVLKIRGSFGRRACVRLCHSGQEVARAVVSLSSAELEKVQGRNSAEFESILGYASTDLEACHRRNIVFTASSEEQCTAIN